MSKKLIVFDWDGVLSGYYSVAIDSKSFFTKVLDDLGMWLSDPAMKCFMDSLLDGMCVIGTQTEMNKKIHKAFKDAWIDADDETVMFFRSQFILNALSLNHGSKELFDYIAEHAAAAGDVEFGLLSNCSELEKIVQSTDVPEHLMKHVFRSCEVGMTKPGAGIYKLLELSVTQQPCDILYVDDREENLIVPRNLGWQVYHYAGDDYNLIEVMDNFIKQEACRGSTSVSAL